MIQIDSDKFWQTEAERDRDRQRETDTYINREDRGAIRYIPRERGRWETWRGKE